MKLYSIIYYYKSDSLTHHDDYVVVGIVDEAQRKTFFDHLNMFARDFYDTMEFNLNDLSNVDHIMVPEL